MGTTTAPPASDFQLTAVHIGEDVVTEHSARVEQLAGDFDGPAARAGGPGGGERSVDSAPAAPPDCHVAPRNGQLAAPKYQLAPRNGQLDPRSGQLAVGDADTGAIPVVGADAPTPRSGFASGQPSRAPQAPPPVPLSYGAPRQERESVIALFLVYMFPIGHLPVASSRPARQLPLPPEEFDYAAGLRFAPHDHPRSGLIDPEQTFDTLRAGGRQPSAPPVSVLPCPPPALAEGYDPLGGIVERDWDHRYLVRTASGRVEYAWPPGESYPEGGQSDGEPVLLAEGTPLDRFGGAAGRVFAPEGTAFARRALPPAHRNTGYRRYRVLRELPVWRTISAGWFGQPGGGVRIRTVYSAAELVTLGYLADVTFQAGVNEVGAG